MLTEWVHRGANASTDRSLVHFVREAIARAASEMNQADQRDDRDQIPSQTQPPCLQVTIPTNSMATTNIESSSGPNEKPLVEQHSRGNRPMRRQRLEMRYSKRHAAIEDRQRGVSRQMGGHYQSSIRVEMTDTSFSRRHHGKYP